MIFIRCLRKIQLDDGYVINMGIILVQIMDSNKKDGVVL